MHRRRCATFYLPRITMMHAHHKTSMENETRSNVNITVSALYRFSLMHLIFNHLLQEATCIKAAVLHYVISTIHKTWHG